MSTVIGQVNAYPIKAGKKESYDLIARAISSTSNGVIDTALSTYSDPQFVILRTGVGTYSVTFPACPADVNVTLNIVSTLAGVANMARLTAFAPTLGTATLTTCNASAPGTATDNASALFEIHMRLCGVIRLGN